MTRLDYLMYICNSKLQTSHMNTMMIIMKKIMNKSNEGKMDLPHTC
jgi:hypothetical protein